MLNIINLFKTHKNKKKNKFIFSERQYIGITATINTFRSTLASCEDGGTLLNSGRIGGLTCAIVGLGIVATVGCVELGLNVRWGFVCVLRIPFLGRFMCPLAVAGLGFRYFVTSSLLRSGHPLRKPFFNAFMRLDIVGLQSD